MSELNTFRILLYPKVRGLFRLSRAGEQRHPLRILFFGGLGLLFAFGIYAGSAWFLRQMVGVELVGALIPRKLLSLVLLVLTSILLLSTTISSFSVFFLSDDLSLLASAPVQVGPLFFARFAEMVLYSVWMVVFFGVPVFVAYATVYHAGVGYYLALGILFLPLVIIPATVGAMIAVILTRLFSARRSRDLMIVLVLLAFIFLYLLFRAMRPERLLEQESFGTMVEFMNLFRAPEASFLPSAWMTEALFPVLQGKAMPLLPALALWTTALGLCALCGWVGTALYPTGLARAQEGRIRFFMDRPGLAPHGRILGKWLDRLGLLLGRFSGSFLVKDMRVFFRDPSQWLQILLLGALSIVYLLNFVYLKGTNFSWFTLYTVNHVLIGLVLSGVAVRFVYPAVSLEGRAWWIVRCAPIKLRAFIGSKLRISYLPLAALAICLSILSCWVIEVPLIFTVVSVFLVLCLTLMVVALGIGIGSIYPRFTVENPAKIPTGVGGVVFMVVSSVMVIFFLLASFYPTFVLYDLSRHIHHPIPRMGWFVWSLVASGFLVVVGTWIPLLLGNYRLSRRED